MLEQIPPVLWLLSAAAVIGFVIGWFARRIGAIAEHNRLVDDANQTLRGLQQQLDAVSAERDDLIDESRQLRRRLDSEDTQALETGTRLNMLQTEQKRRDLRITELETQLAAAEEQHIRVQRDFARFRVLKARELEQLQMQLAGRSLPQKPSPERTVAASDPLPVLKRKASSSIPTLTATATEVSQPVLSDISNEVLETDEDVLEMTSEFDFDPAELLDEANSDSAFQKDKRERR